MSRLEELIAELCPNGVEYRKLGDISQIVRGASPRPIKNYITEDIEGVNWIKIGDVATGSKYITETKERITKAGATKSRYVKPGDFILSNSMSFGRPYILKIDGCIHDGWLSISDFEKLLITDFLYYVLESTSIQNEMAKKASFGGAVQNLNADIVKSIKIPVPPLEVQREIVRVLDHFTLLSAELSAELKARKEQYEYYRNDILHLDGERITLQDLFETRNGFTPSKSNSEYWEGGTLPWFKIDDINDKGRVLSESYLHITEKALKKSGLFPANSIIISTSATIGEYALITVPFLCNQRFTCLTVKSEYVEKVNVKYLMHYCPILSKYCKNHLNQGNFASVDMKKFSKFEFVIPSLDEQNRIVDVLDNFERLCNDISDGLPAEIEARKKQYEYYRDKLLSFKEIETA